MSEPEERHNEQEEVPKPKNATDTLRRLWRYLWEYKLGIFLVLLLVAITAVFHLLGPYLMGKAIDDYIIPRDLGGLLRIILVMALIYILTSLFTWLQSRTMINVSQTVVRNMRKDAFDKLQELPVSFFDTRSRGDIMSRLTNDIDLINNALSSSVTQIFSSVITLVGALTLMLRLSPLLTGISMITVPVMFITTNIVTRRTRRYFEEQQKVLGALNGFVEE
ncbi:MAG TPA: ABC transporter ATP-binding protein, partial [Candidatus Atribacteria bacterium]|nr:ABC transporter ATP-binding protein [Candidatus Atribacteria bacterium]